VGEEGVVGFGGWSKCLPGARDLPRCVTPVFGHVFRNSGAHGAGRSSANKPLTPESDRNPSTFVFH
jgi:hypothetical protein